MFIVPRPEILGLKLETFVSWFFIRYSTFMRYGRMNEVQFRHQSVQVEKCIKEAVCSCISTFVSSCFIIPVE